MVCYLDTVSKLAIVMSKSRVSWMTVMWQTLSVSKEALSLLSTSKMAAVGLDIKIYRHSQALKFVLEQEHISL